MQNTKPAFITSTQSAVLVRNVFRAAFSSIAYIRNFFGEENFELSKIGETQCYKIRPTGQHKDDHVQTFVDWLEKGVFHALEKKFLDVVLLEVFSGEKPDMAPLPKAKKQHIKNMQIKKQKLLECFCFRVSYSDDGAEVHLSGQEGDTSIPTKAKIKKNVAEVLRSLIELTNRLRPLPSNHVVGVKLLYTPNTPVNYEPPQFSKAESDDMLWFEKEPTRTKVGALATPHHQLSMMIRTAAGHAGNYGSEPKKNIVASPIHLDENAMEIDVGGSQGNSGRVAKYGGLIVRETQEEVADLPVADKVDRSELGNLFGKQAKRKALGPSDPMSANVDHNRLKKRRKISKGNGAVSKCK